MSLKFGLSLPQGWTMELANMKDPVEAYETMTQVALSCRISEILRRAYEKSKARVHI